MKSAFKTTLLLAGLLLGQGAILQAASPGSQPDADKQEFTKVVKKEFDIVPNGTTAIINKYGRVDVKTWDRNRVKIGVTILVNANSESNAQRVFDRIEIEFSNQPDYVKAETIIESVKNDWMNWGSSKMDFSINYEVFLPPSNNLELTNKYGDAQIAALDGRGSLDIKYGNFKAEALGDDSRIRLKYGNGELIKGQDLWAEVEYSRLNFREIKDMEIASKYSKIFVDRAGDVRASSKYDTYELGEIRDFLNQGKYDNLEIRMADVVDVASKYTEIRVGQLNQTLTLNLEYGGGRVDQVSSGFSSITLDGRYSDFKIQLHDQCRYQMEAEATYAGIGYPSAMTVEYEVEKGSVHQVKGYEDGSGRGGVIKAKLSYGGLKVRKD